MRPSDREYRQLLEFRDGIRRFLHWSEEQALAMGLTAAQHQLLLAVRGHAGGEPPTIGDVAQHLLLKPHSAAELVGRAEAAGLLERATDEADHRVVRLRLSQRGEECLAQLASQHLAELRRLAPSVQSLWVGLA